MHTTAKVKNLNLATGEKPEPQIRAIGEEQVVAAATGLIANTDAEAASLVSLSAACPDNVFVVAPGVDLTTYNPADGKAGARTRLDIAQDAIMLTFVGRIQAHKGPDVLLKATAQMLDHTPYLRSKLAAGNDCLLLDSSHISFFPDFIQVKVFVPTRDLLPAFEHVAPALAAA